MYTYIHIAYLFFTFAWKSCVYIFRWHCLISYFVNYLYTYINAYIIKHYEMDILHVLSCGLLSYVLLQSFPRKLLRPYHPLLNATREIIARICIYTPVPSAVPSANSIVTNDLRVKFHKCRLLPARYVKPRIVCKWNDVTFADEFVPLIHPFPLHRTNPGWSTR